MCTIGGNVAENSGGAHCLKYGFTVTHALALEVVLPSGELVQFGSPALDAPGYDLAGVFVGSEGTLGVATKVTLRIVKRPEVVQTLLAAFDSPQAAGQTVSDIIAAGMLPSALEIMDALAIQAAEAAVHAHYPVCGGLLLVELDGPASEVEALMRDGAGDLPRRTAPGRFAWRNRTRSAPWYGRGARLPLPPWVASRPTTSCRTASFRALRCRACSPRLTAWPSAAGLRVANVFHAGDGNLHPLVLYDRAIEGQEETALDLSYRILHLCVDSGGSITGEHGVGKEKQEALGYMFSEPDLAHHATGALRLRSGEHLQPGQGLSAAAAVRGEARPLHAAPAGNGRHRGDLLMSATSALTLEEASDSSGLDRRSRSTRVSRRDRHRCSGGHAADCGGASLRQRERRCSDAHRQRHQAELGQSGGGGHTARHSGA